MPCPIVSGPLTADVSEIFPSHNPSPPPTPTSALSTAGRHRTLILAAAHDGTASWCPRSAPHISAFPGWHAHVRDSRNPRICPSQCRTTCRPRGSLRRRITTATTARMPACWRASSARYGGSDARSPADSGPLLTLSCSIAKLNATGIRPAPTASRCVNPTIPHRHLIRDLVGSQSTPSSHTASGQRHMHSEHSRPRAQAPAAKPGSPRASCALRGSAQAVCRRLRARPDGPVPCAGHAQ